MSNSKVLKIVGILAACVVVTIGATIPVNKIIDCTNNYTTTQKVAVYSALGVISPTLVFSHLLYQEAACK